MNDGGHAFPIPGMTGLPNGEVVWPDFGMSLRDYFAREAMSIAASRYPSGHPNGFDGMAAWAYSYADAMIAFRERKRS